MGVIKSVKKMPRKVKKAIRRTLSGVCIFSALIVALIPAKPTEAYITPTIANSYNYGVEATDKTDLATLDTNLAGVDLSKYGKPGYTDSDSTIHTTMTINRISSGAYEIGWQFKLYTIGNSKGIICSYNSMYQRGNLDIKALLPLSYLVVESDFFDDYYAAHSNALTNGTPMASVKASPEGGALTTSVKSKYTMKEIVPSSDYTKDYYWITKYFPEKFADHEALYAEWKTKKDAYDAYQEALKVYNNLTDEEKAQTKPPISVDAPSAEPELICWVSDMYLTRKYAYFCEAHPYYQEKLGGRESAATFVLEKVVDSRNGSKSETEAEYCYLPKGEPNYHLNSVDVTDEFGFLGSNWTFVLGIGDKAFANTQNVTSLTLCDEMKYIGDEAFYNSFVESVEFRNVQDIGNGAFKLCTKLNNVDLSDATVNIANEAFYGCNTLTELSLPQSIKYIGKGAFAECTALSDVDLSKINQSDCNIDDFAFYNCMALTNLSLSDKIARIGEGAFAAKSVTGNLKDFVFPRHISSTSGIGDFVLAGRTNLETVTMPSDYGRTSQVILPYGVFYNCINLKKVIFPADGGGSCGYVTFADSGATSPKRTIFDTIQSPEFAVYGPELTGAGDIASPRKSTWGLKSGLGHEVPYIYTNSEGEQVEISNGQYIFIIDGNGIVKSCQFADPSKKSEAIAAGIKLEIPEYVGDIRVNGIASDCFSDLEIRENITEIKIADNTLSAIADNAFSGCKRLKNLVLGDSVTFLGREAFANCPDLETVHIGAGVVAIGDSAFENCKKLSYVSFDEPINGYDSFPLSGIGNKAFSTGADSLTFCGPVDVAYGPFQWAMQKDNYVDPDTGTRVCYLSGYPNYQTILIDNRNGYPTLVDYLHYDQLDEMDCEMDLCQHEKTPGVATDHSDKTVPTLTYRYEHLGEEIKDNDTVIGSYTISLAEQRMIDACLNPVIPSGVESVDVNGFMNNSSRLGEGYSTMASNSYNVQKYLLPKNYYVTYKNNTDKYVGGLFKGFFGTVQGDQGPREYPKDSILEKDDIGNDRIQTITLNTVKYLPDYCFYSCENLYAIDLGSEMEDIGIAPFTGCTSLSSMGSHTSNYVCYNGIIYSENPDGTYTIVEVLSSRGDLVGSKKIRVSDEDPYMANVSGIAPGAFENCGQISGVDFTGTLISDIPDNCFRNAEKLNQIILPSGITKVGHNAFAGTMEGVEIVAYGEEIYLPFDSFGNPSASDYVKSKRVVSYENSAVRKAAKDLGADVSETLDSAVKVQFFDYNGDELSKIIYVPEGGSVQLTDVPANPVRDGYTFAGWNKPLTNLKEDTVIVATYTQDSNGGNGGNNGGNTDISGNNGNNNGNNNGGNNNGTQAMYTLTVNNGNGSGSYAAGATVIITVTNPPAGMTFDKWVPASDDLGIASVNVAATTLKMPAHEASVTATFKKESSVSGNNPSGNNSSAINRPNNGTNSSTNNNSGTSNNNGNTVVISKPGVSNTGLANISVNGSNDNYVVRIAETASATQAVEKALTNEYGSLDNIRYSAMDITLYDKTGTNRITNYNGLSVTITMPIPDTMTKYAGNNKVAAVSNEKLEKLTPKFTTIDGVPCVSFTATHFSPYVIYADITNLSVGVNDTTPKTGDGIQPKWFLVFGLAALGIALLFVKDKKTTANIGLA